MTDKPKPKIGSVFSFIKGGEDVIARKSGVSFDWEKSASKVRENLNDAMNAKHISFLFGSGTSSLVNNGEQVGIPTMAPMARKFVKTVGKAGDLLYPTESERNVLVETLGLDITNDEYLKI